MKPAIYQVDSFTSEVFRGNPAGVMILESWPEDEMMQNIALENNLSETAFVVPEDGIYRIRWFTPGIEVDLCGHATLAAAHVLFDEVIPMASEVSFKSRSGILAVEKRQDGSYAMNFPADLPQPVSLAQAPVFFDEVPIATYRGKDDFLFVFETEDVVAGLIPNLQAITSLNSRGVIATAPGISVDFVSRCFFPNAGIPEDPVTGSAHTLLTPYWAERLGKTELTARQISKRSGDLGCIFAGKRVIISGNAITYSKGLLFVNL